MHNVCNIILITIEPCITLSDVQGVAYLYKKVVSPSLNVTVSNWQRQPHWRHVNEYQKQDKLLKVGRQVKSPSPTRSVVSCPGSLETTDQSTSQVYPGVGVGVGEWEVGSGEWGVVVMG